MKNKQVFLLIVAAIVLAGIYFASNKQTSEKQSLPQTQTQTNTAECSMSPTLSDAEGPYYKSGSPQRTNIAQGVEGEKLIIEGVIYDRNCKPLQKTQLDFWQAGANGQYDNVGYKLRGHQYTDSDGKYILETVVPAAYATRPSHIHLKVKAEDGSTLTTQLYFPNAPVSKELILDIKETVGVKQATFDFIL